MHLGIAQDFLQDLLGEGTKESKGMNLGDLEINECGKIEGKGKAGWSACLPSHALHLISTVCPAFLNCISSSSPGWGLYSV